MGLPGGHGPLGGGSSNGMGDYLPPSIARGVPLESSMNGVTWGLQRVSWARAEQGIPVGVRLPLESLGVSSGDPDPRPTGPWTFMGGGVSIIRMGVPSVGGPSGPHGTGSRGPSRPLIRATWTGSSGGSGSSYGARASYPWTGTPPRGGPPSSIGSLTDPSEGEDRTRHGTFRPPRVIGRTIERAPEGTSRGSGSMGPGTTLIIPDGREPFPLSPSFKFRTGGAPKRRAPSEGPKGGRARPLWAPVTGVSASPGGPRLRVPRISRISRVSHHLSSLIIVPYRVCPLSSLIISYRPPSSLIALIASQPPHSSRGSPWPLSCPPMDPHAPHAPMPCPPDSS
ncbi:hypothetical protein GMRT_21624 [Giardia muris]|uniref:Uncharacterized protein n=1 Tax=Giardia muris TaxID=5742 RepID=A0A4Z1SZ65_GIAMU|nr:hypothetical protein GMRT_21624 [Giardia muris]|eukprot:TNJ30760.1 hypothetical protein GMRT_21624 [Giardia muris]